MTGIEAAGTPYDDKIEKPLTPRELAWLDPVSLACTQEFAADGWRDEKGRDLYQVLVDERGGDYAHRVWRQVCNEYDAMNCADDENGNRS